MSDRKRSSKAPLHLLPARALRAVSAALEHGDLVYEPGSWRRFAGDPSWKAMYAAAMLRHLTSWLDPDEPDTDPDSGLSHLAHLAAGALIALWLDGQDYRPSKVKRE